MIQKDLMIIGGGIAGLFAAHQAGLAKIDVLLIESANHLGGQLLFQTQPVDLADTAYDGLRGFEIIQRIIGRLRKMENVTILTNTTVTALYPNRLVTTLSDEEYCVYQPKTLIVSTGSYDNYLAFENNDLPGIYGAKLTQILLHQYGILPGKDAVIIGSSNQSFRIAADLIAAGAKVRAILETSKHVIADSKHQQIVDATIYTSVADIKAIGYKEVEALTFRLPTGELKTIKADFICVATGYQPMHHLFSMAEAQVIYDLDKGGFVPVVDQNLETSVPYIYACGHANGIKDAASTIKEAKCATKAALFALSQIKGALDG